MRLRPPAPPPFLSIRRLCGQDLHPSTAVSLSRASMALYRRKSPHLVDRQLAPQLDATVVRRGLGRRVSLRPRARRLQHMFSAPLLFGCCVGALSKRPGDRPRRDLGPEAGQCQLCRRAGAPRLEQNHAVRAASRRSRRQEHYGAELNGVFPSQRLHGG